MATLSSSDIGVLHFRLNALDVPFVPTWELSLASCISQRANRSMDTDLKIATFNINNVNKRLPNLLAWLKKSKPDIACLQELKCETSAFPAEALAKAGYQATWVGQKSWNGVAILSRGTSPVVTRRSLPGDPKDHQARYIEAAVNGILIACVYMPNGNRSQVPNSIISYLG